MKRHYPAGALLVSLIMLSGLLAFLFLSKDRWLSQEKISRYDYERYLTAKWALVPHLTEEVKAYTPKCRAANVGKIGKHLESSPLVLQQADTLAFRIYCQFHSFFLKGKPTKKSVETADYSTYLNEEIVNTNKLEIADLAQLPANSVDTPKIVVFTQDVEGKLNADFYGIIITTHRLQLKHGAKFYGTLYSPHAEDGKSRYITHSAESMAHLEKQHSAWYYQPQSRNLLTHANSP